MGRRVADTRPVEASPDLCEQGPGREPCRRRDEILDAATELFAEHGFSDAVTQLLTEKLGIGKGTIYRHFPSKRELFLAAVDRVMQRLHERMEIAVRDVADPLDRIARAVREYLDFFAEHPRYVELLIQERAQFKDRDQPTYFAHRERNVSRWRELYRGLIAEGRVREMPVERITDVIMAALYGAIFVNYFNGRAGAFATGPDDIIDVFFRGILSDRERQRRRDYSGQEDPAEPSAGAESAPEDAPNLKR